MFCNWRASEANEPLSGLFNQESLYMCHSTYVNFSSLTFSVGVLSSMLVLLNVMVCRYRNQKNTNFPEQHFLHICFIKLLSVCVCA